jgi:fibronectin-binding autotransporter adhesin
VVGTLDAPSVFLYSRAGDLTVDMNKVRPTATFRACVGMATAGCSGTNSLGGSVTVNNSRTVSGDILLYGTAGVTVNNALASSGGSSSITFWTNNTASSIAIPGTVDAANIYLFKNNGDLTVDMNNVRPTVNFSACTGSGLVNCSVSSTLGGAVVINNPRTVSGVINIYGSTGLTVNNALTSTANDITAFTNSGTATLNAALSASGSGRSITIATLTGTNPSINSTVDADDVFLFNGSGNLTVDMNTVRPTANFRACVGAGSLSCSASNTSGGTVTINNARTVSGDIFLYGSTGLTINNALTSTANDIIAFTNSGTLTLNAALTASGSNRSITAASFTGTSFAVNSTIDAADVFLYYGSGSLSVNMNDIRPTRNFRACVGANSLSCLASNNLGGSVTINNSRTVSGDISLYGTTGVTVNNALVSTGVASNVTAWTYNTASSIAIPGTLDGANIYFFKHNGDLTVDMNNVRPTVNFSACTGNGTANCNVNNVLGGSVVINNSRTVSGVINVYGSTGLTVNNALTTTANDITAYTNTGTVTLNGALVASGGGTEPLKFQH